MHIDGGVTLYNWARNPLVPDQLHSFAARFKVGDCWGAMDGVLSVHPDDEGTAQPTTMPTVTDVRFASLGLTTGANGYFLLAKLVIVPRAWSDAELISKSAT